LARLAQDISAGVTLVPAFNGLGAPWWDPDAVGLITGLTLGSQPAHIARASLESVAHQVEDVLAAMAPATGRLDDLLADGGASSNADLMQLQADVSGRQVHASTLPHLSPLGAAHLGGMNCGLWTRDDVLGLARTRTTFVPRVTDEARLGVRRSWKTALVRARTRVEA